MSIIIKEDKSYLSEIDLLAVKKGVAELGIHSIRFDINLTEEQKQENRKMAEALTREEWSKRCEQKKLEKGKKIEKVIDAINDKFIIYQYKDKDISYSNDDWDLFFWCNQGDMSYVTLNPNDRRSVKQQVKVIDDVLNLVEELEVDEGVSLTIQYTVHYNDEKVKSIISKVYDSIKDSFIEYMGMEGKIKDLGTNYEGKTVYGFFKKRARKNYYQVSKEWFLQLAFNKQLV